LIQLFPNAWQVLRVALLFPIFGKVLPRDLSPLKPISVEGAWERVKKQLATFRGWRGVPTRDFLEQPQLYELSEQKPSWIKLLYLLPRVRNSEKLEKPSDKEPLVGRGL
jgi:hypothetical protein